MSEYAKAAESTAEDMAANAKEYANNAAVSAKCGWPERSLEEIDNAQESLEDARIHLVRALATRNEESRRIYVAGWNMPGFLPEMDPVEGTEKECRDFLAEELADLEENARAAAESRTRLAWDDASQAEDEAEEYRRAREAIQSGESLAAMAGGSVYWVRQAE